MHSILLENALGEAARTCPVDSLLRRGSAGHRKMHYAGVVAMLFVGDEHTERQQTSQDDAQRNCAHRELHILSEFKWAWIQ